MSDSELRALSHLWMNTAMSITLPMSLHAVDKAWSIAPRMQIWLSSNRWMHPASRIKRQSARAFPTHPPAAHTATYPRFPATRHSA